MRQIIVLTLYLGAKEYSNHKGTTLIGTVKKEDKQDEDSLLEVA